MLELLRSLGYKPTAKLYETNCNGKAGKPAWKIYFKGYADQPVFKLTRKVARLCQPPATRQRSQTRQIVAVRPVPSVPVRCILVSSPSHLFLAGAGMVPTHNTALSPVVHVNNIMANVVMADWHDIRAEHVLEALRIFTNPEDQVNKDILNKFEDMGGMQGLYVLSELQRQQIKPLLDALQKDLNTAGEINGQVGVFNAIQQLSRGKLRDAAFALAQSKTAGALKKAVDVMMNIYSEEDTVFRMAAFIRGKRDGMTDAQAGKLARESFMDYNINAPWIQVLRQTTLPFISFTYRALPMLLDVMQNKPWKILKFITMLGAVNALGYALSGGNEDKERRLLPEEKQGRLWGLFPKMIRMPWNDKDANPIFLDIRRFLPIGDFFDVGQTHAVLPILPSSVPGGPLALVAELLTNKSQFTGQPIVKDTDTPLEVAQKVVDYIYKSFAPNAPWIPFSYSYQAILNAGKGRTDVFGREQSVVQAIAS
ncbi:MAG: hypothetical protein ACREBG_29225, partial [Pyrinomonadaceae bacterium]